MHRGDIELVIFDLGGTTMEDKGQVPEAFSTVLRSRGIEVTDELLRTVRGASKREVIRRFVESNHPGSEAQIQAESGEIFDEFRARLADNLKNSSISAVPGAEDTFERLHRLGIKVAINTGFDRAITGIILGALGWDTSLVDAVACGDDVARGRPAPYLIFHAMESADVACVHRVACVGDTTLDLQAGWNAGVRWNIGVLSGAHDRERLERVPHTHLLDSVAFLPALWE